MIPSRTLPAHAAESNGSKQPRLAIADIQQRDQSHSP